MEEVRPTRSELLDRRSQIQLAEQGMDLLKQKRDALLIEFMSVMDETLRLSTTLQRAVSDAQYSLAVAKSVDGNVSVRSVAMATKGDEEEPDIMPAALRPHSRGTWAHPPPPRPPASLAPR